MNRLVVMYSENRKDPKNTWSGTSYSLRQELANYVDVQFVDLHEGKLLRLLDKLSVYVGKYHKSYIFGPLHDFLLEKKASILLKPYKGIPVLEIGNEVKIRSPYYVYQDLSLVVLPPIHRQMRKKGFESCGGLRMDLSDAEMRRKISVQEKIYRSSLKSYFMGSWVTSEMKKIYPDLQHKFCTAGGGINAEFCHSESESEENEHPIISFVGIDFKRKGGELVLEAFSILKDKYKSNAELYIVGPDYVNDVPDNIDGIHLIGKIDRNKLAQLFSRTTVFCLPSEFEAYGLVFPEALSFGIPCVGRNKYEMRYFISEGENGYLLKNDDANELADLLYSVLNNEEMKKNTRLNAAKTASSYSWENVAKIISQSIFT